MKESSETPWLDLVHHLGKDFMERAAEHDRQDTFVNQNYADLKKHHFFSIKTATIFSPERRTPRTPPSTS
jgi:hypothetical protein